MKHRPLGGSGLEVSCIGLGAMPLSIYDRPRREQGLRTIHAALDAGMTFIDTADVYCRDNDDLGHNERLIATALSQRSDAADIIVATKGGLERPGGAWQSRAAPEQLKAACEASLVALGVDTIRLYQLHAPDPVVPFAESVGALAELRAEGKVEHVGLSNVGVAHIREAAAIVPIASVQNRCNPYETGDFANGVIRLCEQEGIAYLPYAPVGGYGGQARVGEDRILSAVAERHGATPYEVALAWLLAKSPAMIPIPGASRPESAASSARSADLQLTARELSVIDRAFHV